MAATRKLQGEKENLLEIYSEKGKHFVDQFGAPRTEEPIQFTSDVSVLFEDDEVALVVFLLFFFSSTRRRKSFPSSSSSLDHKILLPKFI